jgi:hypothetical protein
MPERAYPLAGSGVDIVVFAAHEADVVATSIEDASAENRAMPFSRCVIDVKELVGVKDDSP